MNQFEQVLESTCNWERETALLESIQATLEWDERTGMPEAAGAYRADQVTYLSGLIHARRTDTQQAERIEQIWATATQEAPHSDLAVTARCLRRELLRRQKLPLELVQATTKAVVLGQQAWVAARSAKSFEQFLPSLSTIVALKREEAQLLAIDGSAYNGLLDQYEEGANESALATMFTDLRSRLVPIVAEAAENTRQKGLQTSHAPIPIDLQRNFNRFVAQQVGFDFSAGRLDETDHPFCTTLGPRDCRILSRYNETDFLSGLYSTLHEAGHGMYEQGLPVQHYGLPLGSYASLGVHESQSRLWENIVGRSLAFWCWCLPQVNKHFKDHFSSRSENDMYVQTNLVTPSLIRVEADEATYNLHIAIRFEIERALIAGQLEAKDLPDAWSSLYQEYLGIEPTHHAEGCLQDVHWSAGLFGYFPTYTLGNLIAAQIMESIAQELGDLASLHQRGDFAPLLNWLRTRVHSHGKRYQSTELVLQITGQPLAADAFINYLRSKLSETGLLAN